MGIVSTDGNPSENTTRDASTANGGGEGTTTIPCHIDMTLDKSSDECISVDLSQSPESSTSSAEQKPISEVAPPPMIQDCIVLNLQKYCVSDEEKPTCLKLIEKIYCPITGPPIIKPPIIKPPIIKPPKKCPAGHRLVWTLRGDICERVNSPPVANAGLDRIAKNVHERITLDGNRQYPILMVTDLLIYGNK